MVWTASGLPPAIDFDGVAERFFYIPQGLANPTGTEWGGRPLPAGSDPQPLAQTHFKSPATAYRQAGNINSVLCLYVSPTALMGWCRQLGVL